jgi:hypothetical protein
LRPTLAEHLQLELTDAQKRNAEDEKKLAKSEKEKLPAKARPRIRRATTRQARLTFD